MKIFIAGFLILFSVQIIAQKVPSKKYPDEAYWEVVSKRAGNIVSNLGLNDIQKQKKVQNIIAFQYYDLNKIHDSAKSEIEKIDANYSDEKLKKI